MIGENAKRIDAFDKSQGIAKYGGDTVPKDTLWLRPVLSPVARANLLGIDKSTALSIPGVVGVITGSDFPGEHKRGAQIKDNMILPTERLNYKGEMVAVVVAESRQAAEAGVAAVVLDYEELPPVLSVEEALAKNAPRVHPDSDNLVDVMKLRRGDFERAAAEADLIVENRYRTPRIEHSYMEPDACYAAMEGDRIIVYSEIQDTYYLINSLSSHLGLPQERICVRHPNVGGAFGGKTDYYFEPFVALATYLYGRPALMRLTRREVFLITYKRQPADIVYTTAVRKDGTILGVKANILCDNGAYSFSAPAICKRMVVHGAGCYVVDNVDIELKLVYTNNTPTSAMRGYGTPQINFALESQLDQVAEALKIDPLELRRKNCLKVGSRTITGQLLDSSVGLSSCLDALDEWRKNNPLDEAPVGYSRGRGLACMYFGIGKTGRVDPATVRLEYNNGKLTVFSSVTEIGQGCCQAMLQIAAHAMNMPLKDITLVWADSDTCPDAGITSASRITYTAGRALEEGCQKLKKQLSSADFNPDRTYMVEHTFIPDKPPLEKDTNYGSPYPEYAFAVQLADVEVNKLTGEVRLLRVVAAHDVGRAINKQMVKGQIEGGICMGAGYALSENYLEARTVSFHEYIIPTAVDVPEMISIIIEDPAASGPYGAKGVGEPALVATASAIVNAVNKAVGVRLKELPITAERVYFAMKKAQSGKGGE